jgi:catechol 2,3-dioxygenase-like lactoylglutathione lyase family enzyme
LFIEVNKLSDTVRDMFDHVQVKVEDLARSLAFYEPVLAALGYEKVLEIKGVVTGFGNNPHDMFEVAKSAADSPVSKSTHIAFIAKSEEVVRAFHQTALEHGAQDNGAPGLRDYEPGYYAAFVIDPDGHNLEAVFKK